MTKSLKTLLSPRYAPAGPLALALAVLDLTETERQSRKSGHADIARELMIDGLWK